MSTKSIIEEFAQDSGSAWVVTYADMMTLILVFFILLYTIGQFEQQSYREVIESVDVLDDKGNRVSVYDYAASQTEEIEPLKSIEDMLGLGGAGINVDDLQPALASELESMIENTDLADGVNLSFEGEIINLQIDGQYLFGSGRAQLKDQAKIIFANLAHLFREYADYRITIRGHTDDRDIKTLRYPSNWELSAVRATTVLRFFIGQGIDPERMSATGYADLLPLVGNDTVENRAINRRVEFVLEKEN